jgi:hypothetical protein
MVQLAQSPASCRSLGEAGRKRVEQEYGFESLADRLLANFHTVARRQRRHALCVLLENGVAAKASPALPDSLMLQRPAM